MSKRKPKTVVTDNMESDDNVTVHVSYENPKAVQLMDEFFILPCVVTLTWMWMMYAMNPAFFTAAYWEPLAKASQMFGWGDLLPF